MKQNSQKNSVNDMKEKSVVQNDRCNSESAKDKINLDYDWNSEYGDGDIPDIDK